VGIHESFNTGLDRWRGARGPEGGALIFANTGAAWTVGQSVTGERNVPHLDARLNTFLTIGGRDVAQVRAQQGFGRSK